MKNYKVEFKGVSPILMHSCRGANPLDPDVKFLKTITGKRKKTDSDHEKLIELEYKLNAYYKDDIGFYIPANVIEQSIINGSKKIKLGKKMPTAIIIEEEYIKLKNAPKTIEEAFANSDYIDIRNVVVNRARIMRARPRFERWSLSFKLQFDNSIISENELFESLNYAGSLVGICDYRPERGGKYGRYEVKINEV